MKLILATILIGILPFNLCALDQSFGGIRLLDGYRVKKGWAVDAATWSIFREGGLLIEFEVGMNEGLWADAKEKDKYLWYREHVVNGHKVMLALIKPGLRLCGSRTIHEVQSSARSCLLRSLLASKPIILRTSKPRS